MNSITKKFISESFMSLLIPKMKRLSLLLFFFLVSLNTFGQYATTHYIAPAPWNYSSSANEFVVSTVTSGTINVTVTKSDGTAITTMSVTSGTPAVYRPSNTTNPISAYPANAVNTIYNDRGLIFTSASPISVSIRNVESDSYSAGNPAFIKGNAALASYGNEGSGTSFRVGYYREVYTGLTAQGTGAIAAPVYSVMAINNNTVVSKNGTVFLTLQAGQSYLFQTTMGDLITSTKPVVMNSGSWRDAPGGCGDGVFDQIPPLRVLGKNYLVVRGSGTAGTGTNLAEQTVFIATQPNTTVTVTNYNLAGAVIATTNYTLATAGSYKNIFHGDAATAYTATSLTANKNIVVYSGTAQSCEVDMSTLPPINACTGSYRVETKKILKFDGSDLPYFGYVLINDATAIVKINGTNLETLGGVRRQLGTTGYYLIDFTNAQLGNPTNLIFTSTVRMSVSMVQQGGGFSMSAYLSSFNDTLTPIDATMNGAGCITLLTAEPAFSPYQWYYNGIIIPGATSQTYKPTGVGNYSVAGTRTCGLTAASREFVVDCVPIDAIDDGTALAPFATVLAGSTLANSVKVNDLLDNVSVSNANTTVTPSTQGPLTINALGIITVAAGTLNGVYAIQYQLCSTLLFPTVCDVATAYVKVTTLPGDIEGNQSICSGGNPAAFTSTSPGVGEGTISYRWESTVSPFSTWNTIVGATAATYAAPAGLTVTTQYRRIAISSLGESDPTTAVMVTILAPTLSGVVVNTTCGNSNGTITITSNATSFLWSDGVTTKNRTALPAGNYSVSATDASGCTATASFVVNSSNFPLITATVSNVNCFGQNTGAISTSMVITGTRSYTYAWVGPSSFTATTASISSLSAGTYNLTVTDNNGCKGFYSANITQPTAVLSASITKNDVSCFSGTNGAVNLIVSGGTEPYTYDWTGPNSFTATSQDLSSTSTGTYNVTVTDAKGCTAVASAVVGTPAALAATLSSNSSVCSGGNAVFTIMGTAGNIVTYTGDSSGTVTIGAGGTVTVTVAGVTSNTTLNLTAVSNGTCSQALADTTTVTVNPLPEAYTVTGGGADCSGGTGIAVGLGNSTTGINYQLQLNGVNDGTAVAGTGSAISFGLKTAAGTYTVIATNAATNCSASMTGSKVITICSGGSTGGTVWYDTNGDGMNDVGENGLAGATVTLDPGTPSNAADDIITTTNATGNYLFLNLLAGTYSVSIDVSTITAGIPAGYNSAQLVPTFDADGLGTPNKSIITIASGQDNLNQNFAYVKPSDQTTGGNAGGVESESLGDAISKIYVGRKKNSVPTEFVKTSKNLYNKSILKTSQAYKVQAQTMRDMFPKELVPGNIAHETSPTDILDYTIADQVLSVDFSLNGKTKAVVLGIKTTNKVYNHTKASCDRLRGAEILNIQKIQLQGYNFLMQGIKQRNGVVEYAISFAVAKNNNDTSYSIQTNWYVNAYTKFNDVYNFQVWSTKPADTQKLVSDILNNLKSYMPINQIDKQKIPGTYASKVYREKGELIVKLRSTKVANTAEISVEELYSETANNTHIRDNTLSTEIKQELRIDIADGYEYEGLIKVNSQVEDAFYHADGNWGLDYDKKYNKIYNYFVWNNFDRKYSDEEYSINRNVEIKATSEDYLTVYKSLLPGTLSADYSEYKYLSFKAKGSGLTELGLIKSSIEDWKSQYRIMVNLTAEEQTYYVPFDAFISANSKESMIPNDLTTLTFTFLPLEAKTKELDMFISNVKFVKLAGNDGIVINKLVKFDNSFLAYPNPSKGKINLMLFSNSDTNAEIILSDLLGRTIYKSSANLKVGRNELDFNFNVKSGSYIINVSSKETDYGSSKIIFK